MIEDDVNHGIVSIEKAMAIARNHNLDLVEVSPNAKPPVCRILDYGKFMYDQKKRHKKQKPVKTENKEVKLTAYTELHDFETKVRQIRQFLVEGKRVKVTFVVKKQKRVPDTRTLYSKMDEVIQQVQDIAKPEAAPRLEGRQLVAQLIPSVKQ